MADESKRVTKRPYRAPQIADEEIFERKVLLACGKDPAARCNRNPPPMNTISS